MIVVYRYRVKNLAGHLGKQARAVNFVWNFCCDTQRHALRWGKKWPSAFDIEKLTAGSNLELGIHSGSITAICKRFVQARTQHRKARLRYRGRRTLGWVPIKGRYVRETQDGFHFYGKLYRVFKSRPLPPGAKIKDGTNFAQDARGNWFINVCVEVPDVQQRPVERGVGIDLGLLSFAALSTGETIENPRHFKRHEEALGKAQRASKKRQAVNAHARITNARRDFLHKLSARLVREFDYIAVGNVNAAGLAKTKLAKSVNDAAWSSFRNMLRFKAIAHGAWFEEVDERYSSQACSSCGAMPPERPKGIAGLGIRRWTCSSCGADHDRDVNAARNILARSGHRALVEGTGVRS